MTCLRIASHALRAFTPLALVTSILLSAADLHAARVACRTGDFALSDAQDIAAIRGAVERVCPCADFDGSTSDTKHSGYVKCAKAVITDAADGTPVLGAFTLRRECRKELTRFAKTSTCGYPPDERVVCCEATGGRIKPVAKCVTAKGVTRTTCFASPFADVCSGDATNSCRRLVAQETVDISSDAQPAETPGTPGVTVTNPKLLAQFGGPGFTLNRARYTRWRLAGPAQQPDAILILVPGFEGGASDFAILAENLIVRANTGGQVVEVWGFDRRTNQLEDLAGADIAEEFLDPQIALDWFFGGELELPLHPALASGPNRRAQFYDTQGDVPFIASWTGLVFSRDIDAVVEVARAQARNQNVFLGGHSAGTGFTARYASTDFNLTGVGAPEPGYAKVRGLVLLEGQGGSSAGGALLTPDTLDRIEAKFDGGLFGAVRDNAPRCVDGVTPCTVATEAADCVGQTPPKCTLPTAAYAIVPGILNPRILAVSELTTIQAGVDPDTGQTIGQLEQGGIPGNTLNAKVPDLASLAVLPAATALGGLGTFIDDDGFIANLAPFLATSVGAPGPMVNGLVTWTDITESAFPPCSGTPPACFAPNHGPPPTSAPAAVWGQEKEVTRFDRLFPAFYAGRTNFVDLYYPSSGLGVTSVTGQCASGVCVVGNVGASCTTDAQCSQSVNLDSSALSIGRGRRDIENLTQAGNINVPVIGVCGTNGLATVPGIFIPFANSIGTCTAPSCDGSTPRLVSTMPNTAFPTFGNVPGGFEVVVAEGFTHLDVLTAEDNADNPVVSALAAFLARNAL
jgi:pimeloyl-ACP methyl ester carboxylesterase